MRVGPYEVLSPLGAGGMGIVFRARDARLGREVAIKVLPGEFALDPTRLERFEREARATAALAHPNILAIHDVGTHDGAPFLVTELLEGETLWTMIRSGLSPSRAVEYGVQIAQGLAAAHDRGIVHRDLKPENVFVTRDGVVKLLDFGLAKLTSLESRIGEGRTTATEPRMTGTGIALGTLGYIAPEQLRALPIDQRADIFALGCVLYEMFSGRRAFEGDSPEDVITAILRTAPPPLAEVDLRLAPALGPIVARCIEKRPEDRFQSARDVGYALQAVSAVFLSPRPAARSRAIALRAVTWATAGLLAVAVTVAAVVVARRWWISPPLPVARHVAALALVSDGSSPAESAFARGLTERLATGLRLLERQTRGAVWVVPLETARTRDPGDLETLARNYGVTLGITGRFARDGQRVRLSLEVVDAATGRVLRSATLDELRANIAAMQVEPVLAVARMLGVETTADMRDRLASSATNVLPALEAFMEGLGRLAAAAGSDDVDAAVERLERAVELDPAFASARTALARACARELASTHEQQWLERGLTEALWVTGAAPHLGDAYLALAELYSLAGRTDEGVAALERGARSCGDDAELHLALGRAYLAQKRFDPAEAELQRAIYLRPGYWPGHHWLARLYLTRGSMEAAATEFRHVVESAPQNYKGYNNLAYVYDQLGRKDESLAALRRSVELEPTGNPTGFLNLGKLYFDDARFADAAAMFEKALAIRSENYLEWGNLAYAYASGVAPARAETAARRAITLAARQLAATPDDTALLCRLAGYHALVGEREEGLRLLQRATRLRPSDAGLIVEIAGTWEDLGDRDRALEWAAMAFQRGVPSSRFENRPLLRGLVADERYRRLAAAADRR